MASTKPAKPAPPGPRGRLISGNIPEFRKDRLGFLADCARDYGDAVSVRLGPIRILMINHPDLIEEVLVTKNRSFVKHFALRQAKPSLGEGLLTAEGEAWRRQRKLAQPAFHRDRVASYAKVMVDYTERMLRGWADGERRDLHEDMTRVTLEIVTKCLFDADVASSAGDAGEAMQTVMHSFTQRVNRMIRLPVYVPTPMNVRFRRALKRLEALLFAIIAERRKSGDDRGDLLSMLLKAQDEENGSGLTDRQLRDEVMTLFMAGHETTANTLIWALYLLARNPAAEASLHAELDQVLGDRPPTVEDLPRLTYTDMVITEALRVYPTVWLLGREAIEPVEVGGYKVPRGRTIWMSQWVLHRDPRYFDDPEAFIPERWADGLAKRLPRYAYFPFGGGPRVCIGNSFAQMEAVLVLATIARAFRLELAPDAEVVPLPTMTLRPRGEVPMILHRRARNGTLA